MRPPVYLKMTETEKAFYDILLKISMALDRQNRTLDSVDKNTATQTSPG